jgi:hypothetical protein
MSINYRVWWFLKKYNCGRTKEIDFINIDIIHVILETGLCARLFLATTENLTYKKINSRSSYLLTPVTPVHKYC